MLGHECAVGGECYAQSFVGAVTRQLKNIGTEERFAATQYQNGSGHFGDLIDDIAGGFGGEIGGSAQFGGGGAAVDAAEIASFG